MKTCKQCGKELKPHWSQCPWCEAGAETGDECRSCGGEVEAGMVLCPECGTKRTRANPEIERFKNKTFGDWKGLFDQGHYKRALKCCDEALKLNPSALYVHVWRGQTYAEMGDDKKAIDDFKRATGLEPSDDAREYRWRSMAFHAMDDHENAIKDLGEAIRMEPSDARNHGNRAAAFLAIGDCQNALKDANEAIRLDPDAKNHSLRADIHKAMKKYDDSVNDYSMAIRLEPAEADHYIDRGSVRCRLCDFKQATSDFEEALRLDPGNKAVKEKLNSIKKLPPEIASGMSILRKLFG